MAQVTYPGVYIQELPSGVHTITSVATSITAFIDFFKEGPLDEAVEIYGMTDFKRVFGGLDDRSEASYAISQFFLNGGSTALVVRCAAKDGTHPLATADVGIAATAAGGSAVLTVSAASAGLWGNTLRVDIDHRTGDATLFNLTVTRYDSDRSDASPIAQEQYLALSLDSTSTRYAENVVNNASKLIQVAVKSGATGTPAACGTTGDVLSPLLDFSTLSGKKIQIKAGGSHVYQATLGTWATSDVTTLAQFATRLEAAIRTAVDTQTPAMPTPPGLTGVNVYAAPNKSLVVVAGRGDPALALTDTLVISDGADNLATTLKLIAADAQNNVQQYPLGSSLNSTGAYLKDVTGADGLPPDADAICGSVAKANQHGIFALDKVDLFNILCIPRAAEIVGETNGETQMQTIVSQTLAYCGLRRAFFILDIPEATNDPAKMKDWLDAHASFRNNNAAVYFPRLQIPDPLNEYRLRSVGASGTMAGVYSRTDSEHGVWKAPAGTGTVLNGVSALDYEMNEPETGTLNPLGINCMRIFPMYGTISWGGRTLEGADAIGSEWKYIPIRRLALMLEESLFRGTKWAVFEPNDEPLWANIRLNVGAYMMSLFHQGAFQGTTPKDAFFVKCDAETTTQDDRNKGIVNILVGFAPLKPAEFVVISIQQIAGQL